jgi:Tfp pilus assembly protein PilF
MFQRLNKHLKYLHTNKTARPASSETSDLTTAGYLVALAILFGLEMLTGCAATQPAPPDNTSRPDIDISAEYQQALQEMRKEQWQAASEGLTRITGQDPSLSGPWVNLGITRTKLGDRAGAEAAFKNAIDTNNRNIEAYNQLGMLYRRHGHLEEARFIYEEALKLDPDNTHLHWNLAILYDRYLPNPHKSLQHYQRYRQITRSEDPRLLAWIVELQERAEGENMTARVQP